VDISDKDAMRTDLQLIAAELGVAPPARELELYKRRQILGLNTDPTRPALLRHLFLASAWLDEPSTDLFFDIYGSARAVPLIRNVARAVRASRHSPRAVRRTERLTTLTDDDEFENLLLELSAFAAYGASERIGGVEFVDEDPTSKTPDLRVVPRAGSPYYVECKRAARRTDFAADLRANMAGPAQLLLDIAMHAGVDVLWDFTIKAAPDRISSSALSADAAEILRRGGMIVGEQYTLSVSRLRPPDLTNYRLYPAPEYYKLQYGFEAGDKAEWHGISCAMDADFKGSFIDELHWESAVRWRIGDDELIWKHLRLPFTLVFKGLEQLVTHDPCSVLHFQYERGDNLGHRARFIGDLSRRLQERPKLTFRWLVFNEVEYGLSVGGRFSVTENAHFVNGTPMKTGERPDVPRLLTHPEDLKVGPAMWGVGTLMPSIDDE
jgi:hypothetical protein